MQAHQTSHQTSPLAIRHARAGKITDDILDQLQDAGARAQDGLTLSEAEATLILMTLPQMVDELRRRRAAMDLINDCTDLDNVRFLPVRDPQNG